MSRARPVGACGRKFPHAADLGPFGVLDRAAEIGLEGVFFRTVFDLSPTADTGLLREVAEHADASGLYLEIGFGRVNPYNISEDHLPRALGDGDYLLGFRRVVERLAEIGCHEVWGELATWQRDDWGLMAIDRFRTDVPWEDQLEATGRLLARTAPILREHGTHLNIETHEEVTSFELLRLVERGGEDAFGITFDTANVAVRGELPNDAARRLAPYVRQTHLRDIVLVPSPEGYERQLRACGDGIIDWPGLLEDLEPAPPTLRLTIEGAAERDITHVHLNDARWRESVPDLDADELARLGREVVRGSARIAAGDWPDIESYFPETADTTTGAIEFLERSMRALRGIVAERVAPLPA